MQCSLDLDKTCDMLWKLAAKGFRRYHRPGEVEYVPRKDFLDILYKPVSVEPREREDEKSYFVWNRALNIPSSEWDTEHMGNFALVIGINLAGLIYGGLHLVAWAAPFASKTERILWRMSALDVVATGPVLTILNVGLVFAGIVHRSVEPIAVNVLAALFPCIFVLYLISRIYLVVESFINIAHLPNQVYEQPSWSQYIPHII